MKYYKVVQSKNRKLMSWSAGWLGREYFKSAVRYMINKWSYPCKNSNQWLYVFDNLSTAIKFHSLPMDRIYECEVGQILKHGRSKKGIVLVNSVKLIKRIR